jgi:uncharacterized membrane-anchored protein YitT (DUF2179 family)
LKGFLGKLYNNAIEHEKEAKTLQQTLRHIRNLLAIFVGGFIYSLGINSFALANKLAEGGFTGIALILFYYFKWSPGLVVFILNIPLLIIGYKLFGKRTFWYTVFGISSVSICLELTKTWQYPTEDLLLAALFTGVLVGIGLGIIFRVGGTSGGVDIIARVMDRYFGWNLGRTFLLFDFTIILISIYLIGLGKAMYTLVAVFVGAKVIDYVVEGGKTAKAAFIISHSPQPIADLITEKMNRGVTKLKGTGAYTGHEKEVLYVVVSLREMPKLKNIVHGIDAHAFVVVNDAREVHGEGFSFERSSI